MRKVIGIGETVLDIIFKGGQPVSAVPGGSVFNGIISLGRAGVPAAFIGEVGDDRIGERTVSFLRENGVDATHVSRYRGTKSPVSLAFLNDRNDAEYIFYKDHPHDRLDYLTPEINRDDILMIGSYYAVNPVIRPQVAAMLNAARDKGAIIYYDVNFRAAHADEVMKLTPNILENFEYADIVRGSRDDFNVMYRMDSPDKVYTSQVSFYCKKFIYTDGAAAVELRGDGGLRKSYPVTGTQTVSTIGDADREHHRRGRQLQRRTGVRIGEIRRDARHDGRPARRGHVGQHHTLRHGFLGKLLQEHRQFHRHGLRQSHEGGAGRQAISPMSLINLISQARLSHGASGA